MKSSIVAVAAFAASAVAECGSAFVKNACDYDVYLCNTPSAGGGYSEIDKVLSPGGNYTQQYTELTNGNGWSIKLSNSTDFSGDILQYEYTYHDDGTIWFDMSEVNGNPWDGDWEITAAGATCVPRQAAYRYATDDAYGMQSCPDASSITVTLCSGESQNDEAAASASSSAATLSSTAAASSSSSTVMSSYVASTTVVSSSATTSSSLSAYSSVASSSLSLSQYSNVAEVSLTTAANSSPSTTLQTSVITSAASSNPGDVIVTTIRRTHTKWVHPTHAPGRRDTHHQHHARHPRAIRN